MGALSVDEELEPLLDLMAEMALLLDRPYDAIQLLGQIIPSGAGGGGGGGGGGASKASSRDAPPPAPPLRLSMLAAAWQCAGQLRAAAHVSSRALASLPKLPLESAAATCLFWLRRGHLLCALHRPVHAADAYAKAADAAPDSLAAREGLLWSRHLSGADAEGALGGGGGALVGVAAAAGGGGGAKGGGAGGAMGLGGPADTHADHTLADAYAALVAEWPAVGVRARLHRAHLMWRRGELRRADAELGEAVKLAVEADAPTSRAGCLAMRALVNARATARRRHGLRQRTARRWWWWWRRRRRRRRSSSAATSLSSSLPPLVLQIVHHVRGSCLHVARDPDRACGALSCVDLRDTATPAIASTPATASSTANANASTTSSSAAAAAPVATPPPPPPHIALPGAGGISEAEIAAVEFGLETLQTLAIASRLQLAFCAAFNRGLAHWAASRPAQALVSFLASQRCGYALAQVRAQHAIRAAPHASPSAMPAKAGGGREGGSIKEAGGAAAETAVWRLRWPCEGVAPPPDAAFATAHVVAGQALHRLSRPSDARAHYRAAGRLQPGCLMARLGLADLKLDAGDATKARQAYADAAAAYPHAALPRVQLARLHHHLGDLDAAMAHVQTALSLEPANAFALEACAVLRMSAGAHVEARDALSAALSSASSPPVGSEVWKSWVCALGGTQERLGRQQDAARLYAAAAECASPSACALCGLGQMELLKGRWESSADLFEAAISTLDDDERRYSLQGTELSKELLTLTPAAVLGGMQDDDDEEEDEGDEGGGGGQGLGKAAAKAARSSKKAERASTRRAAVVQLDAPPPGRGSLGRARALRGRASLNGGLANLALRNLDQSRAQLDGAVALRYDCGRTLFDRGVMHMVATEWESAERDLASCLKLLPSLAEAWARKSKSLVRVAQQRDEPHALRMRHALVDYANALFIIDHQHERKVEEREKLAAAAAAADRPPTAPRPGAYPYVLDYKIPTGPPRYRAEEERVIRPEVFAPRSSSSGPISYCSRSGTQMMRARSSSSVGSKGTRSGRRCCCCCCCCALE